MQTSADARLDAEQLAAADAATVVSHPGPPTPGVPWWHLHRRLYDWTVGLATKPYASAALGAISFAESSFFPLPPDVLLAPMCLGRRNRAFWFALVTTVTSVAGAVVGWLIGRFAWGALEPVMYDWVPGFTAKKFATVEAWYDSWGVLVLFIAAFTPIPFKVFTIAGGVLNQALLPFVLVSLVGRGLRFFLVAGLLWWVGPRATPFIDKYFNWLCVAAVILGVGGFLALKLLH